ncbi:MAG: tandem-95 repeat protein, partial [Verrucomicrobiales bacterium]|nr:tandem-95 repeat protein [Verrucomicrobiales bacterium]
MSKFGLSALFLLALFLGHGLLRAADLPAKEATAADRALAFLAQDEDFRTSGSSDVAPHELLVRFRAHATVAAKQGLVDPLVEEIKFLIPPSSKRRVQAQTLSAGNSVFENLALVKLKDTVGLAAALAHFRRLPGVVYAEPNFRLHIAQSTAAEKLPNDFDFGKLWSLQNTGQTGGTNGAGLQAPEAWGYGTGSRRVKVAVIDTGIDYFHPDLVDNIWVNDEIPGNGEDDDHNGYIDDVHGYDFVTDDSDPLDDHSHGTHIAGIIGAVGNNRIGISGICWNVTLIALKCFDETGSATIDDVVESIHYAIENGANIINASWGNAERSRALEEAIAEADRAGLLVVAAAGNDNSDTLFYPAVYPQVISVAATDQNDRRARFSNYGPRVDISAPGELIYSTLPDTRYDLYSGTSMAAPHAAGLAALVLANHPEFSNRDLANILRNSVDPIAPDKPVGTGRINAVKAMRIDTPLPFVALDLPASLRGVIPIRGSARGTNFASYTLDYGTGVDPKDWLQVHSSTVPVDRGLLFEKLDTPHLAEGTYTFRLTSENTSGHISTERVVVAVANVHIDFPLNNDVLRAGDRLSIRGSVFGEGRTYHLEYGQGANPTSWTGTGITLANGGMQQVLDGVLATWDTSVLKKNEFYTLRLTGVAEGRTIGEHLVRSIYFDGQLKPGWPQYLPITGEFPTNDWRAITVADLAGDGSEELVLVDPGNIDGRVARLLVYGFDGTLLWARDLGAGDPYWDVPVVGDMDGDGRQEIFVDTGDKGELFGFHFDGTPLSGNWPVHLDARGLGKVLADLDGDGTKELIGYSQNTAKQSSSGIRRLVVVSAQGSILRQWELGACDVEVDGGKILPAVGNLDGDPDLEIVVPSGCKSVSAYQLKKADGPLWTAGVDGDLVASAVIGDLDGTKTNKVVVGTYDDKNKSGGLYVFHGDGRRYPGWPVLVGESFASPPALADLDEDGSLEIYILGRSSELLHAVQPWGFEMIGWPVGPLRTSSVRTSPVIGDVDGDGRPDVVMPSLGYLYLAFTAADLKYLGGIKAWNSAGLNIDLSGQKGVLLMEGSGGAWGKSAPLTLTDLDHNGKLDLVVASIQDRAYASYGQTGGRKGRSSIYVWELETPFDATKMPWPMLQANPQHTGSFPTPKHINTPPVVSGIPHQTIPTGGNFVPIELDTFVEDADNFPGELLWSVGGNSVLKVTISTNRVVTVWPAEPDWAGSETLRFTVKDPGGLSSEASVVYSARPGYVPPAAAEDRGMTPEDQSIEINPLANDTDPNGGTLGILNFSKPRFGKTKQTETGTLLYTPKTDFYGPDEFTYTLSNGKGGIAIGSVKLTVTPVNDSPVAAADYLITDEDIPTTIDVLANDADADEDGLTLTSFTQPENGELVRLPDGVFRYTPKPNYSGSESFSYRISDGASLEVEGTVNVLVKSVNDTPEGSDIALTLNRNASTEIIFTAQDVEGDELTFRVVRAPEHGELLAYPEVATYTPKKSFVGTDIFTYVAHDGNSDSREMTVNLTVLDANNLPEIQDRSLVTRLDQGLPIELAATDLDGDPVTFRIAIPPRNGTLMGSETNYLYEPSTGFLGTDSFTFEAADTAGGISTAKVEIRVTNENTAPVADDLTVKVRLNTPATVALKATDGEASPLTYQVLTQPSNGTLSGFAPKLTYTPNANFIGSDRFTFKAHDGELESNTATVLVAVEALNHPAITTNQMIYLPRNTTATILLDVTD